MKIGVLSDTHMMTKYIDKAIPYLNECDLIIHAGDNFRDSKYIHQMTKVDMIAVKGNCDFENVEDEILFEVENKNILVCHGDKYDVKYGIDQLQKRAVELKADIVIFGHTHVPLCLNKNGINYINPGSISLPREVIYRSFIILTIENNNVNIEQIKI